MKKGNRNKLMNEKGFTLIEMVVALATLAVIGMVTTGMLVSALTWGDRVRAMAEVDEGVRVLERTLRNYVMKSTIMTESPSGTLLLTGPDECFTLAFSSAQQVLRYSKTSGSGCVPSGTATENFLPGLAITGLDYDFTDFTTGGRQLNVVATIEKEYPLGSYSRDINITIMNYLINEL